MRFAVKLATEIRDEFWNTHKSQVSKDGKLLQFVASNAWRQLMAWTVVQVKVSSCIIESVWWSGMG